MMATPNPPTPEVSNARLIYNVLYTRATSWLAMCGGLLHSQGYSRQAQGAWDALRHDIRIAHIAFTFSVSEDKVTEDVLKRLGFTDEQLKGIVKHG